MKFLFVLLTIFLQTQSFTPSNEFYFLIKSSEKKIEFSTFRLSNPNRIILEINSKEKMELKKYNSLLPVTKISIKIFKNKTRLVFFVKDDTFYNVLNKNNALLIAFKNSIFIDNDNFDTIVAKISKYKQKPRLLAKTKNTTTVRTELKKHKTLQKENLIAKQLLQDLKNLQKAKLKQQLLAEKLRKENQKRIAELKKQQEQRRIEQEKKRQQEILKQQLLAEKLRKENQRRIAELKKQQEQKRIEQEKKRQQEILKQQLLAEKLRKEKQKRIAELKKQQKEKKLLAKIAEETKKHRNDLKRLFIQEKKFEKLKKIVLHQEKEYENEIILAKLETQKTKKMLKKKKNMVIKKKILVKNNSSKIKNLKIVKLKPIKKNEIPKKLRRIKLKRAVLTKKIEKNAPSLKVVKLRKKGFLKNLFFRKFPDFSRITLKTSGALEYRFREIKGGFVIDVFNLKRIPRYLSSIIDTRAFNAEVKYVYPKKKGKIFKIYIKTIKGVAVRKSEENNFINFDFFVPTI